LTASTSHLVSPHGGELVNLIAQPERADELKAHSREWPSWDLTPRQLCDVELLLSGGFSPLHGFMNKADYESVCHNMKLSSGLLWPMPITLDVTGFGVNASNTIYVNATGDPVGAAAAVPVPAAAFAGLPLLGGLGFFGWRKRKVARAH